MTIKEYLRRIGKKEKKLVLADSADYNLYSNRATFPIEFGPHTQVISRGKEAQLERLAEIDASNDFASENKPLPNGVLIIKPSSREYLKKLICKKTGYNPYAMLLNAISSNVPINPNFNSFKSA